MCWYDRTLDHFEQYITMLYPFHSDNRWTCVSDSPKIHILLFQSFKPSYSKMLHLVIANFHTLLSKNFIKLYVIPKLHNPFTTSSIHCYSNAWYPVPTMFFMPCYFKASFQSFIPCSSYPVLHTQCYSKASYPVFPKLPARRISDLSNPIRRHTRSAAILLNASGQNVSQVPFLCTWAFPIFTLLDSAVPPTNRAVKTNIAWEHWQDTLE